MKTRVRLLILAAIYSLSLGLVNVGAVYADSRPYFKVYGADVSSGGWFYNGAVACDPTDRNATYQTPDYVGATKLRRGGIMAYGKFDSNTNLPSGAGSEFGALSLGLVEGSSSGEPYGFSTFSSGYNSLTLANKSTLTTSNYWGGFLEGNTPQTHCIPDYFSSKQHSPVPCCSGNTIDLGTANGQYIMTPGAGNSAVINPGGSQIPAGANITVFVNGNALISNDIIFQSGYTADHVTKFALVVKGNIFIQPNVSQLDGFYIAQPSAGTTGGEIWTCHDSSQNAPTYGYVSASCRSKLTFNGAVVAARVNLVRVQPNPNGGIDAAAPGEAQNNSNIAEVFNFTPEMIIGGGFFNEPATSAQIKSLINLPPIF